MSSPPQQWKGCTDSAEPDIHGLLCHYNSLYFDGDLGCCVVSWTNSDMFRHASSCHYEKGGYCEIHLSKFVLSQRPIVDLKNTLLREMIHAYLWIRNQHKSRRGDHGKSFEDMVNKIESSSVNDPQRPVNGYKITHFHDFEKEDEKRGYKWISDACGDCLKINNDREPSSSDYIEKEKHGKNCDNPSCSWYQHKLCSGSYRKMEAQFEGRDSSKDLEGERIFVEHKSMPSNHDEWYQASADSETQASNDAVSCEEIHKQGVLGENCNPNLAADGNSVTPIHLTGLATRKLQRTGISDGINSHIAGKHLPAEFDDNFESIPARHSDSQRKKSSKRRELKDTNLRAYWSAIPGKPGQSGKTKMPGKKREHDGEETNECNKKPKNDHSMIIEWLDWFSSEEDETEHVEPLVNKRTERRKEQKLLKIKGIMENRPLPDALSPRIGDCCQILEDGKTLLSDNNDVGNRNSNAPVKDYMVCITTPGPGRNFVCGGSGSTGVDPVYHCYMPQNLSTNKDIGPFNSDACKDIVCPLNSSSPDTKNIMEISDG